MYFPSSLAAGRRKIPGRPEPLQVRGLFLRAGLAALVLISVTGCESLSYYPHVIRGHLEMIAGRESIEALIADPKTDAELRGRLQSVMAIRRFAAAELLLPVDDHYRSYVDLNRPYVTWNVYATPEFSLKPKTWKYPIIGPAGYRGFFSPELAEACAAKLRASGFDVYVAGAAAYSTLGWFEDPLPSTVVAGDEIALANVIFHELAHQLLYVSGDTPFNESFAVAVAAEGTRRYLGADPAKVRQYREYRRRRARHNQFTELVADFRRRLETLYRRRDLEIDAMRRAKQALFAELTVAYQQLKSSWRGDSKYDAWFAPPLNNAKLASLSTYNELVPSFFALLEEKNGDLPAFYAACRNMAELPAAERRQQLQRYAPTTSTTHTTVFKRIHRTEIKKIQ